MNEELRQIGYHYYPDDLHFTSADLSIWLPILRSLGARWLTLKSSSHRAVPEHFLRGLIDADIKPVIRIPVKVGTQLEAFSDLITLYADWGIQYVIVYDRPNMQTGWRQNEWSRIRLIERFVDFLIPVLKAQQSAGLKPVFPPLEPGGDYWDTAFLDGALAALKRRAPDQVNNLTLATYAWTYGHPLDWGSGGPDKWIESIPYNTPEGSQDQRGLQIFDWYSAIYQKFASHSPSFIVAAGGSRLEKADPDQSDYDQHTMETLSITRMLQTNSLPSNLLNFSFYCLASETPSRDSAWFRTISDPLPVVKAMQDLIQGSSKNMSHTTTRGEDPIEKPLAHYVLLPHDLDAGSLWDWKSFGDFIRTAHPVIGFSADEASYAERVTLVGSEQQLPLVLEQSLQAEGCIVSRLDLAPFSELVSENESSLESLEENGAHYG